MKKLSEMTLAVIGVGLIGGSLARVLRAKGSIGRVIGVGRGEANLKRALELGVVDSWTQHIEEAVKEADLVCVAVPMGAYAGVFSAMKTVLSEQIVFDAGSTKQSAIQVARQQLAGFQRFVPAHPLAGTEQSGVDASFESLFENRLCILTPEEHTDPQALDVVEHIWQVAGSRVLKMDASQHDAFLAGVSHLPHVAAYALVYAISREAEKQKGAYDPFDFAAGGFRDFTRIASSSPELWRDIALNNREAVLNKMDAYQGALQEIRHSLETGDGEALLKIFSDAKTRRDAWVKSSQM